MKQWYKLLQACLIFSEHSPAKLMPALKIPLNVFLGPALWQRVIFVLSES